MPAPKDPTKNVEWRQKLSNALKGDKSPNYGKSPSKETRMRIGAKHKGKIIPQEMRVRISATLTGRTASEKTRKLLSEQRKGKPHSEEWNRHIRESQIGKPRPKLPDDVEQERRRKISLAMSGENAPSWKGGVSFEPYCEKFNDGFKERVRAFFDYQCQFPGCGHIWQPGERRLAVHHANFRKDACCAEDVIPLFVSLCHGKCHSRTNKDREYWEKYFTELIMTKYNGRCYLPKNEMNVEQSIKGGG